MTAPDITARLETVDDIIRDVIGQNPPPGLAIGIVYEGKVIFQWCDGYAHFDQNIPVTADTVFRIGSISKLFTTIAVMQLWEQGHLGLDDPVNPYLKAFGIHPPTLDSPAITIHHLLTHTSGLGRGETVREFLEAYGHFTGRWEPRFESLNAFYGPDGLHPAVPAGTKYSYSNNGFAILGQLVEDVSGQSFTDYMRQHIFDALGMTSSDVIMSERTRPALAMGYRGKTGDYHPIRPTELLQQGAGSMLCSLTDMMTFVKALIEQDARLLQPESWQQMFQAHWQPDPRLWTQAYGMEFQVLDGHRIYNQAGGAGGFNANIVFSRDHQLGLVALSNRHLTIETFSVTQHLLRHLLDVQAPVSEDAPIDKQAVTRWKAFTGYYAPSPGWKTNIDFFTDVGFNGVHVTLEEDRLMIRSDFGAFAGGVRLYPDADDPLLFYARFTYWSPFVFRRNANGQIDGLLFSRFYLTRQPVSHSLKYRLKRVLWGSLGVLLLILVFCRKKRD